MKKFRVRRDNRDKYFPFCPRLRKHVVVDRWGFCKSNPKSSGCDGCWSHNLLENNEV